jgi:hypothetical protein
LDERDRRFESVFLQQRVCEPPVPLLEAMAGILGRQRQKGHDSGSERRSFQIIEANFQPIVTYEVIRVTAKEMRRRCEPL